MPAIWQLWAPGQPGEACSASPPANGGQRRRAAPAAASESSGVPPAFPPHALPQASSSPGPEVCRPGPRPRQAPGVGQVMPPWEMAAWGGWWWLRTVHPWGLLSEQPARLVFSNRLVRSRNGNVIRASLPPRKLCACFARVSACCHLTY